MYFSFSSPINTGAIAKGTQQVVAQPSQITLPNSRLWVGDSQLLGAAPGTLTHNSVVAFNALWGTLTGVSHSDTISAVGGKGLADHRIRHEAIWGATGAPRSGPEWVHFVETGGQDEVGQFTPTQYGDTLESYVRWINTRSPNCLKSTETPTSYGRFGVAYRDWTLYAAELLHRVSVLAADGITLHVVDTNSYVLNLEEKLGYGNVWYLPPADEQYHFKDIGNLMIAIGKLWTFGYDLSLVNFSAILSEGIITQPQIDACLDVVRGL